MLNSIDAKADYIKNMTLEICNDKGENSFAIEQISVLSDEIRELVGEIKSMVDSL